MVIVPYLVAHENSIGTTGAAISQFLRLNTSIENPRTRGFKILTVSDYSSENDGKQVRVGHLELQYADGRGFWQQHGREIWLPKMTEGESRDERAIRKATNFYRRFIWLPSSRTKIVIAAGLGGNYGVELLEEINARTGNKLVKFDSIDALDGCENPSATPRLVEHPTLDAFMRAHHSRS